MTTVIQFDEATHTYSDEFGAVPHVTDILRRAGVVDSRWFTPEARTRGQYVAQATHMDDEDDLDIEALDERLRPYVEAWRRFKDEAGFVVEAIEEAVRHPYLRYAGTLDRRGLLNGLTTIIDIKTGSSPAWHGLQLAGYAGCLDPVPQRRCGVTLKPNGRYSLVMYERPEDFDVFRACVTVAQWTQAHGGDNG